MGIEKWALGRLRSETGWPIERGGFRAAVRRAVLGSDELDGEESLLEPLLRRVVPDGWFLADDLFFVVEVEDTSRLTESKLSTYEGLAVELDIHGLELFVVITNRYGKVEDILSQTMLQGGMAHA